MAVPFSDTLLQYSHILQNQLQNIVATYNRTLTRKNTDATSITIYNTFDYAWDGWKHYITKYSNPNIRVLLLGINPGPHGMVQTGVPFGAITPVTQWLNIHPCITPPKKTHPKRPVLGLAHKKEEKSGTLFWNTMKEYFTTPHAFSSQCMVLNYCPLAFFSEDGANLTPHILPKDLRDSLERVCNQHLLSYIQHFPISTIIAIGRYSEKCAQQLLISQQDSLSSSISIHYLTHPSPLNPLHRTFPQEFERIMQSLSA